jgi:cytochrome c
MISNELRRRLMLTICVAGASALLVACGDSSEDQAAAPSTPTVEETVTDAVDDTADAVVETVEETVANVTDAVDDAANEATGATDAEAPAITLADGVAEDGQKVFKRHCFTCHFADTTKGKKQGPHLVGIVDRAAASIEGFAYSKGMKAMGDEGLVWTEEIMFEYLEKPRNYVKGTKMNFAGLRKPQDRADVVAYLKNAGGE